MKQSEIIKHISDKELRQSVVISQLLFLLIGFILSLFLFDHVNNWVKMVQFDPTEIVYYGIIPGIGIVIIDLILIRILPYRYFNDDGINQRIFSKISVPYIFCLTLLIAVSEEVLFRGVIQTTFGFLFASLFFTVVHIRYLRKPVLLISTLFVSFIIGYIFELTGNILATITIHFLVDFLLGLLIRYHVWGE
ncbi:CPBP family intramembrane glutamic endopeptidase [Ornithinibacillus scapharcae]|uniref:CPBP family intramembrane glutamic endopeptidase n=1 Tax=Ornithinibacillus scapharcae TaxID=1147159 RepID=UPI000225BBA7|nr:CPBP family intramembrane glutamic endopeptidase [Ornithinibacillus scapharcae]